MQNNTKTLIMTLGPLGTNYGGILQAYALHKTLEAIGFNNRVDDSGRKRLKIHQKLKSLIKLIALQTILKDKIDFGSRYYVDIITKNTQSFIHTHIDLAHRHAEPRQLIRDNYCNLVVGSDQVWRSQYADVRKMMLDSAKNLSNIKRISYAASFGKDDLSEYDKNLIKSTAELAKLFDGLSVREESGVELCKKYWGAQAIQHVDPTLLLEKTDYLTLINNETKLLQSHKGELFTYILDKSSGKQLIVDMVSDQLKLATFDIMPPKPMSKNDLLNNKKIYALPPVTQWLKSFADAEFVITDSFHGCVFAIIFNKPFIAIGNEDRGLTRFTSLLKVFNLENRLITDADNLLGAIEEKINWDKVNYIKSKEKGRAISFLKSSIGERVTDEGVSA